MLTTVTVTSTKVRRGLAAWGTDKDMDICS
jgi:hypothetical protein